MALSLTPGSNVTHVREIILQRNLAAESPDLLNLPWTLRIYTLGRFSVVKDGLPLTFTGKSPRKPLELLQALIALGGRGVHMTLLTQSVWPNEDSTNIRKLFDNTLHRLRHILGHDDAIVLSDGKLTLDSRHCWVDAWAFDRLGRQYCDADCSFEGNPLAILQLYHGHFLAREVEQTWLISYRDRLRSRYQRLVRTMGARFEQDRQWVAAAEVYERGIEVDNLAECLYQRIMICHQQRGEKAEALLAYRHCRDALSIVLGIAPSPSTEKIRRDVYDGC